MSSPLFQSTIGPALVILGVLATIVAVVLVVYLWPAFEDSEAYRQIEANRAAREAGDADVPV